MFPVAAVVTIDPKGLLDCDLEIMPRWDRRQPQDVHSVLGHLSLANILFWF